MHQVHFRCDNGCYSLDGPSAAFPYGSVYPELHELHERARIGLTSGCVECIAILVLLHMCPPLSMPVIGDQLDVTFTGLNPFS
jgi:hypothetical protein